MQTQRKWMVSLVVAVVAGGGWLALRGKADRGLQLPQAEVEYMDAFKDWTSCTGRPKPESERYVSVQVGGRLEALTVKVGDTVAAGQIIGFVDKTLNASNLKSALSNFRLAQKDYGRMAGLVRSGSASREEYDRAQANLEVKRADLAKVRQGFEDSVLRADHSGRVSVLVFQEGDKIPDGGRVAAIEAPGALQLSCRLPSAVADILDGQSNVRWTDLDTQPPVTVEALTTIVGMKAGSFVGVDREVRLGSDDPKLVGLRNKRVQVDIELPPRRGVAKLPSDGVIKRQDGFYGLVMDGAKSYSWVKVTVVRRDASFAYVTGLNPGSKLMRITSDLNKIEKAVAKNSAAKPSQG